MITNEIIDSFLRCDYKSHLQFNDKIGSKTEYELLENQLRDLYKNKFYQKLRESPENQILSVDNLQKTIQVEKITFIIAPTWESNQFHVSFDALELLPNKSSSGKLTYILISISPKEKVSKLEKLSFVIKCLILEDHGIRPEFGKIIYGCDLKYTKIKRRSRLKNFSTSHDIKVIKNTLIN